MPEGPSIVILKELVQPFKGKKILQVSGNSKENIQRMEKQTIRDIKSWGKHFLICFDTFTLRIHFLMFGSYRINEQKDTASPRIHLQFKKGELNFYTCSVKFIEGDINNTYDWSGDVMSDTWDPKAAKKKLKLHPAMLVSDALLMQDIFAGVGNIIKNEVLFRIKVHPESTVGALPTKQLNQLIKEARNYAFDFLAWKKAFVLKKHYLIYNQRMCPRCNIPVVRKHIGKTNRRTFYCENCQVLYG